MRGYQFLRQRPVLNYIADFMCKELMLIIEVDGMSHDDEERWALDKNRQKELEEYGFTVLRFLDEEVMEELEYVEQAISEWIVNHPPAHSVRRPPSKGARGMTLEEPANTSILTMDKVMTSPETV